MKTLATVIIERDPLRALWAELYDVLASPDVETIRIEAAGRAIVTFRDGSIGTVERDGTGAFGFQDTGAVIYTSGSVLGGRD